MAKAEALLVGVLYTKSGKKCAGADVDVSRMAELLRSEGYSVTSKLSSQATHGAVVAHLEAAAARMQAGDIFVFYFSGHGGQTFDAGGDEWDQRDETLELYDRLLVDDTLAEVWDRFGAGVRIVMLSDSCNSGTNARLMQREAEGRLGPRSIGSRDGGPRRLLPEARPFALRALKSSARGARGSMKAQMIHMGGCQDGRSSWGSTSGGNFTRAIYETFHAGGYSNYEQFFQRVRGRVAEQTPAGELVQVSTFNTYGPIGREFLDQRPFQVGGFDAAVESGAPPDAEEPPPEPPPGGSSELDQLLDELRSVTERWTRRSRSSRS